MQQTKILDVVIVGAGLSGIGAAYHLKKKCPAQTFAILEGRSAIGGTWDLFKYPGIRSDSDMYTFGFSFFPWKDPKSIADGPSILKYINETADTFGIRDHIRFNHKVIAANWSSEDKIWRLEVEAGDPAENKVMHTRFLFMCSGYYNYDHGYEPEFPNSDTFKGIIVHPQHWDPDLDYRGKRIVIIGSGATAVTLLPELAKKAREVTMLQRSPTYIMNLPAEDAFANFLKKALPAKFAHTLSRWKNILIGMSFYNVSRTWPNAVKRFLMKQIEKEMGDQYEEKHFNPSYNPWDQRLCLVPDNDLFKAVKSGKAKIVTDTIETFTEAGITLASGETLKADIIVTATGLQVQFFGGMKLFTDGKAVDTSEAHAYRGVMMSDVPNFAIAVGYTNASWTLKCDLNCHFVTRVLNHMKKHDHSVCTPRFDPERLESEPLLDFSAGYILRAGGIMPKQGSKAPWKVHQNYIKDVFSLKYGDPGDEYLEYA